MENEQNLTEVQKLAARFEREGVVNFHCTLAPVCTASVEEIARSINEVSEWFEDPINNLIGSLGGYESLLRDSSMQQSQIISEPPYFVPIPLTYEQKQNGRIADLINEAISTIEKLRAERDEYRKLALS